MKLSEIAGIRRTHSAKYPATCMDCAQESETSYRVDCRAVELIAELVTVTLCGECLHKRETLRNNVLYLDLAANAVGVEA